MMKNMISYDFDHSIVVGARQARKKSQGISRTSETADFKTAVFQKLLLSWDVHSLELHRLVQKNKDTQ